MQKKIVLLSLLVCITGFLKAQNFSLSWGEERKMKYQFDNAIQLPNGNSIIVKLRQKTNSYGTYFIPTLLLMDTAMETIKENEIKFAEKNTVILGFEKCNGTTFFIYTAFDMDELKTSVYGLKIDESALTAGSKIVLGSYPSENWQNQPEASYKISTDSSKLLLFVEVSQKKKENKKLFITLFDSDLNKQWNRDITLSMQERYVSIYDKDITDDGQVFVAIKHYEKEVTRQAVIEKGKFTPSYIYKLLIFSNEQGKDRELAFNLNDKFIHQSKIVYNKNGAITAAGLFKKLPYNYSNLSGIFYTQFNVNDNELKEPVMIEFPKDLIDKVKKDRFADINAQDPGLHNSFEIVDIIAHDNGSVDLISEYQGTSSSGGFFMGGGVMSGMASTNYVLMYGDIINTHIDINGAVVFTRIPKNQKDESKERLGYYPLLYNDKLVLLFNDNGNNVDKDLNKRPDNIANMSKSVIVAATIDATGNLNRQIIYDSKEDNFALAPRRTKKIATGNYLLVTKSITMFKNRQKVGTLKIE